jgi:hypothetical protein
MNSTTYFRVAAPHWGVAAAYTAASSCAVAPAICGVLLNLPPVGIVASAPSRLVSIGYTKGSSPERRAGIAKT